MDVEDFIIFIDNSIHGTCRLLMRDLVNVQSACNGQIWQTVLRQLMAVSVYIAVSQSGMSCGDVLVSV